MPRRLRQQDLEILHFAGLSPLYVRVCDGERALLRRITRLFQVRYFRPEVRQELLEIIEETQDIE